MEQTLFKSEKDNKNATYLWNKHCLCRKKLMKCSIFYLLLHFRMLFEIGFGFSYRFRLVYFTKLGTYVSASNLMIRSSGSSSEACLTFIVPYVIHIIPKPRGMSRL